MQVSLPSLRPPSILQFFYHRARADPWSSNFCALKFSRSMILFRMLWVLAQQQQKCPPIAAGLLRRNCEQLQVPKITLPPYLDGSLFKVKLLCMTLVRDSVFFVELHQQCLLVFVLLNRSMHDADSVLHNTFVHCQLLVACRWATVVFIPELSNALFI
jgi:hypothetical protein